MTVNRRRGEVAAELDGQDYRLCLTLGALAERDSEAVVPDPLRHECSPLVS